MKAIFVISAISLLLLSSTLVMNGALASQPDNDKHDDDINGPGGLLSYSGAPSQTVTPGNPLQIKEHHPAHVKKFVGPSVTLSGGESPANVWTAYGFNKLSCTHTTTTDWTDTSLCGHGQTIAIVDAYDDPNIASDLQTFDTQFGLPACTVTNGCFTQTKQGTPATDSGWAMEIALDVQWAHSIAPGAKIVLVESTDNSLGNLLTGDDTAAATGAQQVSNSWGGNEFSSETSYDYHFNSPTASFYAASGDSGHGVIWPAASPYVVSVGGTTLTTDSSGNWVSESAWSGSGGGTSAYEPKPSYQNNFNSNSKRSVPDVAYDGDPNTGFYVYDSVPINGNSGWWLVGGTSAGAPQWAAISAIANSQNAKLASASFGANSALYGAASGAQSSPQTNPYLANYHDITTGSDGSCGSICNAIVGYDEVTGLGTPQSNNVISFIAPTTTPDFTISANPSSFSVSAGTPQSSTITITSLNAYSGTVTLSSSFGSFDQTSLTVPASGTATATLTFTPTASTTITVSGTSGTLNHSATITVTVPTVPSAPQNLAAVAGNNQVSLTWNPPVSNGGSTITGYDIFRNGTQIATNYASTSYTDTGLTNGDTNTYYVTAVNAIGQSPQSNSVSSTPVTTPTLQVKVTTDHTSYSKGSRAHITVTVNGPSLISGASVTLTVKTPTGSTAHATATTNSNGQVTFSYSIGRTTGIYTASAIATKSGFLSGSGSTTFTVH
ncbi:MAG: fibronectin type III domain-containing protein [Candidatus Nitrosotalea sp.]|nr:fibronectin type III domain-containing protein [Candidatus Nitrosotalea sp.]